MIWASYICYSEETRIRLMKTVIEKCEKMCSYILTSLHKTLKCLC